ncbi:hypothetical protein SUGI_0681680 [Cryptomeria japonica]|nr:hypothetical protein SUGI_0681680 [Cryptomeria japonica]
MALKCSLLALSVLFFHVFLVSSLHAFKTDHQDGLFRGLDHDVQVLLELRRSLEVDSSFWDTSESPCEWFGVDCDEITTNDGVGKEKRVVHLELDSKQLKGRLSPAIGRLSELKNLSFANNLLVGRIPKEIASCLKLEVVDLSGNKLSGPIPSEFGNLRNLKVLHLSDNSLSGEISVLSLRTRSSPDGLSEGPFPCLEYLNLANNHLTGPIPQSLGSLPSLEVLDLHNNFLHGPIPWGAWFKYGADPSAFSGNTRLCGRPLKACPKTATSDLSSSTSLSPSSSQLSAQDQLEKQQSQSLLSGVLKRSIPESSLSTAPKTRFVLENFGKPPPSLAPAPAPSQNYTRNGTQAPPPPKHKKKKKLSITKWVLGDSLGLLTGAISAVMCSFLYRMLLYCIRGRSKDQGAKIYSSLIKKAEDLAFLNTEDGLRSAELIGKGGSGEVYRTQLRDGREIAIKKIAQPSLNSTDISDEDTKLLDKRRRQIRAELDTLGHIRHRNLVTLLAYIARPDCHLLIYDYMKNGSIHQALERVAEGTLELAWPVRHKIAMGIATGLQYLHFHSTPKIIHRDLKPGNILLDENFEAHVADFGLAKALPDTATHATTSNVAGTVGYIAPEYHQTLKFTDKCDVYSFGVVLAVLVTGKNPYDDFFQTIPQASIPRWLRNVVGSETASCAIDPQIRGQGYDDEIFLVMKVACFCTDDDPNKRPNTREVLTMLSQIRE